MADWNKKINEIKLQRGNPESATGVWSSGMILASGARGREFDSRNTPFLFLLLKVETLENVFKNKSCYCMLLFFAMLMPSLIFWNFGKCFSKSNYIGVFFLLYLFLI